MGMGFTAFCIFYMVAVLLDATEVWEAPLATVGLLLAIPVIYLRGVTRWSFFAFLVASSAYILAVKFPDPANHNNLALACNAFMMVAIVWASRRPDLARNDDAFFELLKPPLRITMSLVYILAGFHKLNSGFFDPQAGCAQLFFAETWGLTHLPSVTLPAAALIAFGASVIVWELGGGLMLWARRTQPVMLVMSWINHAILAELVFFDFSSMAFAFLLTFIPAAYWGVLEEGSQLRLGRLRISRLGFYIAVNVVAAAAAGLYFERNGYEESINRYQGLALNVGLLVFLWPIVRRLARGPRPGWTGVPMWRRAVPRWAALLPLFVLVFGLSPYLGLRTAGTFNMFSNLQIEADRSNHLLLGSNPLKIWGLQEDAVQVIAIDPRHTDRKDGDLTGNALPVLEFQKDIVKWRKAGLHGLYAHYRYDGREYWTTDLVVDNPWHVKGYRLVHYLLDFRLVQQTGPIQCRW
jgi:hypothetical protein